MCTLLVQAKTLGTLVLTDTGYKSSAKNSAFTKMMGRSGGVDMYSVIIEVFPSYVTS